MPCEYQLTEFEKSLFDMAQTNEGYVGFDGKYTLPTKQRIWTDVFHEGEKSMLLKVLKVLPISQEEKTELFWKVWQQQNPKSVNDLEEELNKFKFNK